MRQILITAASRYPIDRRNLRRQLLAFMAKKGLADDFCAHILVVGDRKMHELNLKHMGRDRTAEVLSFPLLELPVDSAGRSKQPPWPEEPGQEGMLDLGEVVISFPQARERARQANKTVDEEVLFLAKHGLKHLLGEHHE